MADPAKILIVGGKIFYLLKTHHDMISPEVAVVNRKFVESFMQSPDRSFGPTFCAQMEEDAFELLFSLEAIFPQVQPTIDSFRLEAGKENLVKPTDNEIPSFPQPGPEMVP